MAMMPPGVEIAGSRSTNSEVALAALRHLRRGIAPVQDGHFGLDLHLQPFLPPVLAAPTLDAPTYGEPREPQPAWIEVKHGYDFCTLCSVFATDGHLASERHRKCLEWYVQEPVLALLAPEDALQVQCMRPGPDWVEDRGGFVFCTLCGIFATDGHMVSEKHQKRVEWHERSVNNGTHPAICKEIPARWGDPEHFELKDNWWHCRLCSQWADDCHVESKKHKKRVEWGSQWYPANGGAVPALTDKESGVMPSADDPWGLGIREPMQMISNGCGKWRTSWQQAWSEEHQQHYYWHEDTRESRWDPPSDLEDDLAIAPDVLLRPAEPNGTSKSAQPQQAIITGAPLGYDVTWC